MTKLFLNKPMIALLSGYAVEKYDMFLYGFFAVLFGNLFLPDNNSTRTTMIFSLAIFSAGYLIRPLGGIFFGHLGDKVGRKKALLFSIKLAIIPPCVLCILPTYNQIGIISPILLLICRLFQGFCSGGEFSGAAVFLQEYSASSKLAFAVSLLRAVGFLGVAIGGIVAYLATSSHIPEWGFRIPFAIGILLTIVLYHLRKKNMDESPSFKKQIENRTLSIVPLIQILKKSKGKLVCTMALVAYASSALYMSTIYVSSLLKTEFNLSNHLVLAINTLVILFWILLIPLLGIWADKIGVQKFIVNSTWCNIFFIYPLFWLLEKNFSLMNFIIFQITLGLLSASFYAPFIAIIPRIFHVQERYSGVALSTTVVQAVLGGITPLLSAIIVSWTGDRKAPSFILIVSALIALVGLIKLKNYKLEPDFIIN